MRLHGFSPTRRGAEALLATLKSKDGKVTIGSFEYQLQGNARQFVARNPIKLGVACLDVQCCVENSSDHSGDDKESYPEGYLEALENCNALTVNLLEKAINDIDVKRCWDCTCWAGRCLKGKINQIARSEACDEFSTNEKR